MYIYKSTDHFQRVSWTKLPEYERIDLKRQGERERERGQERGVIEKGGGRW